MYPMPPSDPSPPAAGDTAAVLRWLPLAVWVASMANALVYLDRGWFPHDLGSVAHPAQRVLLGEMPHRDFQDVYTGGLAYLNALAYLFLGQTAMAARWVALGVYAAWIPAVWSLTRRLTGRGTGGAPWLAAAATLLAGAWTLPMYAEGMPSWFNLFCATFALLALVRFHEDGRRRWLFLAGVAGGASVLFKIVGLYAVAAGLLAVAWLEDAERGGRPRPRSDLAYRWFIAACAMALVGVVAGLVTRAMGPGGLVRFAAPAVLPAMVMAVRMRRPSGDASSERFQALLRLAAPFVGGVAAALVPFLAASAAAGALGDLYTGVFVLPQRRLADAAWGGFQGGLLGMGVGVAAVALVAWGGRLSRPPARWAGFVSAAMAVAALALSGTPGVYLAVWQGLWWLPPIVAGGAAWRLVGGAPAEAGGGAGAADRGLVDTPLFLALAFFGLVALVEIPFAAPIYFFFAAPLMVVVTVAMVRAPSTSPSTRQGATSAQVAPHRWLTGALVFLLAFTALRLNPGFVRYLGLQPTRHQQTTVLPIPRGGGLKVDAQAAAEMETVVAMVEALAPGPYIYVTPDAPELYFLTGRQNPTSTLFEFLDPDQGGRTARVLAALDRHRVPLVVINRRPFFSGPVSDDLVASLQTRYPSAREVGRFLVVWKAPGASPPESASPSPQPPPPTRP